MFPLSFYFPSAPDIPMHECSRLNQARGPCWCSLCYPSACVFLVFLRCLAVVSRAERLGAENDLVLRRTNHGKPWIAGGPTCVLRAVRVCVFVCVCCARHGQEEVSAFFWQVVPVCVRVRENSFHPCAVYVAVVFQDPDRTDFPSLWEVAARGKRSCVDGWIAGQSRKCLPPWVLMTRAIAPCLTARCCWLALRPPSRYVERSQ